MTKRFKATVNGTQQEFVLLDQDKLTWAEADAIERVSDQSIFNPEAKQTTAFVRSFYWVSMKRKEPTLTFSDLDDMAISDFEVTDDEDEKPPGPTKGEDVDPVSPAAELTT